MNQFPMYYMGSTIASQEGLYGLIRCVGENIRSGTGGNRQSAVRLIEYARTGGWITEQGTRAYCTLLMGRPVWEPTA